MTRLSRATYSLMVSLLPATATVVGIFVLTQIPTLRDLLGVGLVVISVAAHCERPESAPQSRPELQPATLPTVAEASARAMTSQTELAEAAEAARDCLGVVRATKSALAEAGEHARDSGPMSIPLRPTSEPTKGRVKGSCRVCSDRPEGRTP
jgi:hypothetical protein